MRFYVEGIEDIIDTDDFTSLTTVTMPCPDPLHEHYITVAPEVLQVGADGKVYIFGPVVDIEDDLHRTYPEDN